MKYPGTIILLIALAVSLKAQMPDSQHRTNLFNLSDDNIAIHGYDPVSYFHSEQPLEGNPAVSYTYKSVTYLFANEENLETLKNNPEKYEPAYGGWCAYAMGKDGSRVKIDPETFKIIDGKVYLFYHTFFVNTLPKWNKKEDQLKQNADKNWDKLNNQM